MSEYEFKDRRRGGGRISVIHLSEDLSECKRGGGSCNVMDLSVEDYTEEYFSKCRRSDGMYVVADCISTYTGASASDSERAWKRLTNPTRPPSRLWKSWDSIERRMFTASDGQMATLDVATYPHIREILMQLRAVVTWFTHPPTPSNSPSPALFPASSPAHGPDLAPSPSDKEKIPDKDAE